MPGRSATATLVRWQKTQKDPRAAAAEITTQKEGPISQRKIWTAWAHHLVTEVRVKSTDPRHVRLPEKHFEDFSSQNPMVEGAGVKRAQANTLC